MKIKSIVDAANQVILAYYATGVQSLNFHEAIGELHEALKKEGDIL